MKLSQSSVIIRQHNTVIIMKFSKSVTEPGGRNYTTVLETFPEKGVFELGLG